MGVEESPAERRWPCPAAGGPISHAVFRLARIHRMVAGQLLREVGLHPGQELLMMRLWESGPQRQADLAAELDTDSASMTRTVQRLERAGYVRRVPDPADGRVTRVEPTSASLALCPRVEHIWGRLEALTTGEMTGPERRSALDLLHRLEDNLLPRRPIDTPGRNDEGPTDRSH